MSKTDEPNKQKRKKFQYQKVQKKLKLVNKLTMKL